MSVSNTEYHDCAIKIMEDIIEYINKKQEQGQEQGQGQGQGQKSDINKEWYDIEQNIIDGLNIDIDTEYLVGEKGGKIARCTISASDTPSQESRQDNLRLMCDLNITKDKFPEAIQKSISETEEGDGVGSNSILRFKVHKIFIIEPMGQDQDKMDSKINMILIYRNEDSTRYTGLSKKPPPELKGEFDSQKSEYRYLFIYKTDTTKFQGGEGVQVTWESINKDFPHLKDEDSKHNDYIKVIKQTGRADQFSYDDDDERILKITLGDTLSKKESTLDGPEVSNRQEGDYSSGKYSVVKEIELIPRK